MRIIFHVGMGKTGTTSIQAGLDRNAVKLSTKRTKYLGPWFDLLGDQYSSRPGQVSFFSLPANELAKLGEQYLDVLKRMQDESGFQTYIVSNEALWGKAIRLQPFFDSLMTEANVEFVGYVRNASAWLPSAYAQWGINHKTYGGPVKPFASRAPHLVKAYREVLVWDKLYADRVTLRHFDGLDDVFTDFLKVIGLDIDAPKIRLNERRSDAQLILRLLFNGRYEEPMDPSEFNKVVQSKTNRVAPLGKVVEEFFDYSTLPKVVAEEADVFQKIKDLFDIDLVSADSMTRIKKSPDLGPLRDDILDYLLDAFITLTERVAALESAENRHESPAKTRTGT